MTSENDAFTALNLKNGKSKQVVILRPLSFHVTAQPICIFTKHSTNMMKNDLHTMPFGPTSGLFSNLSITSI